MSLKFDWDSIKASTNIKKHGIAFNEAATVFGYPLAATFYDPDHSHEESRYVTIGFSERNRILVISHTDRNGVIRIISARKATNFERRFYEEKK